MKRFTIGLITMLVVSIGGVGPMQPGTALAAACAPGSWSATGDDPCTPADTGHYVPDASATSQTECDPGTYQDETGQTSCKNATAGHFVDTTGQPDQTQCPVGFYQPDEAQTGCIPAPAGTSVGSTGAPEPTSCAVGTFQPDAGQTTCILAPPGRYVAATGATRSIECDRGTYQDDEGQTTCELAPEGTYVPGVEAQIPTDCPTGEYQPIQGQTHCLQAPAGSYVASTGSMLASECDLGKYQPLPGQSSCDDAPIGHYVDTNGAISPTPCPQGRYQDLTGQTACKNADEGTYVPSFGAALPIACPTGTFQAAAGADGCDPAAPGTYVPTTRAVSPTNCAAGSYQPLSGQSSCLPAPAGTFVSTPMATGFTLCSPASYQDVPGQLSCVQTPPGTYAAGYGERFATDCRVGSYQPDAGRAGCRTASIDFYVPTAGATAQIPCPSGASTEGLAGQSECVRTEPDGPGDPDDAARAPFVTSVAPARLLDTRANGDTVDDRFAEVGSLGAGEQLRLDVAGRAGVPDDTTAVVVNITAINPTSNGYVTVHPCLPTPPSASSLNFAASRTAGNEIIAELDDEGDLCLFTSSPTQLVVDLVGVIPADSAYQPVTPRRFVDTRSGGETVDGVNSGGGPTATGTTIEVQVADRDGVPSDATAAVVNVTAINPSTTGYVTVHPCLPSAPLSASLNFDAGLTRGNEVIAELDDRGRLCVTTTGITQVSVDVVGVLVGPSDFEAVGPSRLLDTRATGRTVDGFQQGGGAIPAGTTLTVDATYTTGPTDVTTIVANVTAIRPASGGFLTVWNCEGAPPLASSLNYASGDVVGNDLIIDVDDDARFCVFSSATTDISIDAVGYQTPPT